MKRKKKGVKQGKLLFHYWLMLALPVLQFIVFYVIVNFNSILLAFKTYDGAQMNWNITANFSRIFYEMKHLPVFRYAFTNSFLICLIKLAAGISTGIFFAYYIYKRRAASGFFKVILFMPSMISAVVLVFMFQFMADKFIPTTINRIFGTNIGGFLSITNPSAIYPTLIVYAIWVGFGVPIVMYVGAMDGIDPCCIEAAEMDGVTPFKELIYIVIPQIFPIITIFVSTGIAALFVDQLNLFTFYHVAAAEEYQTMGYYMYVKVLKSTGYADYPYCAALGLIVTAITLILLVSIRKVLSLIDPMKEAA